MTYMSDKDEVEEVFLDATAQDDEVTPRRSNRKRRSTTGSASSNKKAKAGKMPLLKSPTLTDTAGPSKGKRPAPAVNVPEATVLPDGQADFWTRMNSMLGGTEEDDQDDRRSRGPLEG